MKELVYWVKIKKSETFSVRRFLENLNAEPGWATFGYNVSWMGNDKQAAAGRICGQSVAGNLSGKQASKALESKGKTDDNTSSGRLENLQPANSSGSAGEEATYVISRESEIR